MQKNMFAWIRQRQTQMLDWVVAKGNGLGLENRAEDFVSRFSSFLPPRSRVLDIGGRWGFYAAPLRQRGHESVVLDVVRPGFQKAPVILYDGGTIPFPDKSFDVSLFVTVLHHIHDADRVVREAMRVTRHRIIVVEDLYSNPAGRFWTALRDRMYNFEWFGHPCGFRTAEQWKRYFGDRGWTCTYFQQVYTWLTGMRILNGIFVFEAGEKP